MAESLEELQEKRNKLHERSKEASQMDINSYHEESKQMSINLKAVAAKTNDEIDAITNSEDYKWYERLSNVSDNRRYGARESLKSMDAKILKIYQPYSDLKNEKEQHDQKISDYYHSKEKVDDLNAEILKNLEKKERQAQENLNILTEKKSLEEQITSLDASMNEALKVKNENTAKLWGETKKEKEAKELYEKLSKEKEEVQKKLQDPKYETQDTKDITSAKESLAKAQEDLKKEKAQQATITQDRSNFPEGMDARKQAENLAKEISTADTPEKKQALAAKIKETPEEILTTKVGNPPETLLNVASRNSQGAAGVALLENAGFYKEDMQQALDTSKQVKTSRQMAAQKGELGAQETAAELHSNFKSMRETLTTNAAKAAPASHNTHNQEQQQQQSNSRSVG